MADPTEEQPPILRARGVGLQRSGDRRGALRRRGPQVRAVHDLDVDLEPGAVLWLVGEPGSAMSAAGVLAGVLEPTAGTVELSGTDVTHPGRKQRARIADQVTCLLPDALAELDEKRTAGQVVADAGRGSGDRELSGRGSSDVKSDRRGSGDPKSGRRGSGRRRARVDPPDLVELLAASGLASGRHDAPVRELTEVEVWAVRVALLAVQRPRVVVQRADDPLVPARVRERLSGVLEDLREQDGTAQVVVAERLPANLPPHARVMVLCGGQVVEVLGHGDLDHPLHPYARTLRPATAGAGTGFDAGAGAGPGAADVRAAVRAEPGQVEAGLAESGHVESGHVDSGHVGATPVQSIAVEVDDPGCPYRATCPRAKARCAEMPALARPLGATHPVACHFPEDPRRPASRAGAATPPADADHHGSGEPTASEFAQG